MSTVEEAGFYADGTSGHSGSDASRERAEREDRAGVTQRRQRQIYELVNRARLTGMTCGEVEDELVLGHGPASAALSRLHKDGHIARLAEKRGRAHIYVTPEWVDDRPLSAFTPNAANRPDHRPMALEPVTLTMPELRDKLAEHDLPDAWAKWLVPLLKDLNVTVTLGIDHKGE